ncbi:Spermidine N(1)-acetyltransferase [subsurface metagenome]
MKKSKKEERIIFLEGKKVVLRPLNKEKDLERCLRWINDVEIRNYITAFLPKTKKQEEEWFDKEDDGVKLAIEIKDGECIGNISFSGLDYRHGIAEVGIFIGEKEYWNNGYGTDAVMILLNYGFNVLNLRKIKWRALGFNKRSINCAKKCGYRTEGTLKKEIFTNGEYVDMACLAVFRKDFLPLWKKYQNGSLK